MIYSSNLAFCSYPSVPRYYKNLYGSSTREVSAGLPNGGKKLCDAHEFAAGNDSDDELEVGALTSVLGSISNLRGDQLRAVTPRRHSTTDRGQNEIVASTATQASSSLLVTPLTPKRSMRVCLWKALTSAVRVPSPLA